MHAGAVALMAFKTLAEEETLIDTMVATGRCEVDEIGTSVEGRTIRLLRMGNPPPAATDRAAILLVGMQHGLEPAGREAILDYADYLSTTADAGDLAMLAAHGVHMIPSVNPDGFEATTRENANGEDLNRDWIALTQPETRAVTEAIGDLQPRFLLDAHEYVGGTSRNDIETNRGGSVQIHGDIIAVGTAVRDAILARATTEGWSNDHWGPDNRGDLIVLDINASYRHIPAVIVETNRTGTPTETQRTDMQYAAIEEIVDYVSTNLTSITSDIDTARAAKAAEGAAGTAAFDIRGGNELDPPPLGYRVTGVIPLFHLQVFGIQVTSPNVVSMAQAAQPLIPFLFDALSEVRVTLGVRLFDLEQPTIPATVQEFAAIVSGSHDPVFEARVLTQASQSGFDPDGELVDIRRGDVQFDATAEAFANISLTVPGIDPDTGQSRFPRLGSDLLMPYGVELFARRGVDIGSAVLWAPLGYFVIEDVEQPDDVEADITLSGRDRMGPLIDWDVLAPREFGASTPVADFFASLVADFYPGASILFDDDTGFAELGRTIVVDENRYEPMKEVADSFGKILYWDGEGVLRVEDAPDADESAEPVWTVKAGRGGVLLDASRRVSSRGAPNGWIVYGEGGTGGGEPVSGAAVDNGPKSLTRWGGTYGKRAKKETLPMVTTTGQARAAAAERLRRHLGVASSDDFGAKVNPALRPRHPVLAVYRDGNRGPRTVETLTIPLTVTGAMKGTTRERTHIVIGSSVEVV